MSATPTSRLWWVSSVHASDTRLVKLDRLDLPDAFLLDVGSNHLLHVRLRVVVGRAFLAILVSFRLKLFSGGLGLLDGLNLAAKIPI